MIVTPSMIVNYEETILALVNNPDPISIIQIDDGPIEVATKYLAFNMNFLWILPKWGIPVKKEYLIIDDIITEKVISNTFTKIYHATKDISVTKSQYDLWDAVNLIYNFILKYCAGDHSSISIVELCKLMQQPVIRNIIDDVKYDENTPTNIIEQICNDKSKEFLDALLDPNIPYNVIYDFHRLGQLNRSQLSQFMLTIGTRTDINDKLIRYPIRPSYVSGINNMLELLVESLAAKKSAFYLKAAIPDSQYFSRKQHLATSALSYIYRHDCGTTLTVPFHIHRDNARNLLGKHYVKDGKLFTITEENYKDHIGQTVELRSPLTCKHTDGICSVCGGELTNYMINGVRIGIASSIEVTDPTTQKILSNKHFQATASIVYGLPDDLATYMFVRHDGEVYWRKSRATALKDYKIGININDMKHISSLVEIKDINALNAEYASSISQLRISTISESDHVTGIINMAYGDIKPYFSKDMLLYIKENYKRLTIDDTIWIPMDAFDIDLPIFGSIIANDSMIHFVKSVVSFLENKEKLSSYTSIPEALRDFSTVVYNKVVANILHLEVMLRAYMVTSPFDFSIPIVTDINDVRFESNQVLNTERSLGTFLAFERFSSVIKSPSAYVIPKCTDPFDIYVGFDFLDN